MIQYGWQFVLWTQRALNGNLQRVEYIRCYRHGVVVWCAFSLDAAIEFLTGLQLFDEIVLMREEQG